MNDKSMDNSDKNHNPDSHGKSEPESLQEKPRLLVASLYDGPLEQIILNNPKLFIRPPYWTKSHAKVLNVAFKEERPSLLTSSSSHSGEEHENLVQQTEQSKLKLKKAEEIQFSPSPGAGSAAATAAADTDIDLMRVPSFRLPNLPHEQINSYISILIGEGLEDDYDARLLAMDRLLVSKLPKLSDDIWGTPSSPDYLTASKPVDNSSYISQGSNKAHDRLKAGRVSLTLRYATRGIDATFYNPRIYVLDGNTPHAQKNACRIVYLDRSLLGLRRRARWGRLNRERRSEKRGRATGIEACPVAENERGKFPMLVSPERTGYRGSRQSPLSRGYMASLFIAMAQQRQDEIIYEKKCKPGQSLSDLSQFYMRYQILVADDEVSNAYIHLYTAQVSDYLLEAFRVPARRPNMALPERDSPLIWIHHAQISFTPFKSFRRRLRSAIMEYGNGTANGFFPGPNSYAQHVLGGRAAKKGVPATVLESDE
ncbi:hypothetical protein F4825DRAFT_446711 [Nemania diffusa]|nr:hypothetical protein F4825DRAFT_446711 [Nemania diffusa]